MFVEIRKVENKRMKRKKKKEKVSFIFPHVIVEQGGSPNKQKSTRYIY